ncbi:MAG: type IV pili methyl-accepting chemotaxis transducer N-terminal domain-containing protein [Rhodocyclaceae bacterium]|nr:type IV pili methyl-accepting chemotaxis transducer N-terminal domain-containing protein [Rhodocyclaceae bacterium]
MLRIARLPGKLGTKINNILLLFFIFACGLIVATLYVGRQLEGGAAAINEAGAERMRTYRIAYLLEQSVNAGEERDDLVTEARGVFESFEAALTLLELGDAERPLFLPREALVRGKMQQLRQYWETRLRSQMLGALTTADMDERRHLIKQIDDSVREFVPMIDKLVLSIEKSNARNTDLMWTFQNALVGFALAGTLLLIRMFNILVILPVENLRQGMDAMATAEFDVRLSVESADEFGDLARGFNRMADHLRGFYDTLEQRVADKTRNIEEKNRELALLYEIAAYLAEPAEVATLCHGVLEKLRILLAAEAGAMRLIDVPTQELVIVASTNLSERFLEAEERLPLGDCLCGKAAACGESVSEKPLDTAGLLLNCHRDGLLAMVAIPIKSKQQVFGIFNLFFLGERKLAPNEVQLLEVVGRHLGVTIENLRLAVREKDMAVSEERNLLAQELHDSIAQSLAFLNIQAQMLQDSLRAGEIEPAREELARMREGIQESYDNVRELLVHFRIRVEHAELDGAIHSALEKFEGQTGIRTSFEKRGDATVTAATTLQVLHILQEALSNVRKHAAATAVTVAMHGTDDALVITVRDDGCGFDSARVVEKDGAHVGIGIMRERAHRIGARLDFDAGHGQGTCVTLVLPRKH